MKAALGALLLAAALGACREAGPGPGERLSRVQLAADFPADLGPAEIDVSRYPPEQRANYEVFLAKCAQCHTTSRAVNAPFIDRGTWIRYVFKMHDRSLRRFRRPLFENEEGRRVIDFLVYDARERKLNHALPFLALQDRLRREFDGIQERRLTARRWMGLWPARTEQEKTEGGAS